MPEDQKENPAEKATPVFPLSGCICFLPLCEAWLCLDIVQGEKTAGKTSSGAQNRPKGKEILICPQLKLEGLLREQEKKPQISTARNAYLLSILVLNVTLTAEATKNLFLLSAPVSECRREESTSVGSL